MFEQINGLDKNKVFAFFAKPRQAFRWRKRKAGAYKKPIPASRSLNLDF
jgi:hypothetical protein